MRPDLSPLPRQARMYLDFADVEESAPAPTPTATGERSHNPLRPTTLDDMIGQVRLRSMLRRFIDASSSRDMPLPHTLLVGPSGTGKSTIATVVANELGVDVYQVEAPVSHDTLLVLRTRMKDRDALFIDEAHQQAIMERRGKSSATQPEVLFNVMEDRTLVSGTGILPFPAITVIAATTDEGALPDAFINRFPLRPVIEDYTIHDLTRMAHGNAQALSLRIEPDAAQAFASACRATPRVLNNFVLLASSLSPDGSIDTVLAEEVIADLTRTTPDGLTVDMQNALRYLYTKCGRESRTSGEVMYVSSIGRLATGIKKSRDTKAIQLRVEPYLIECGYLEVLHNGRALTEAGIRRAQQLLTTT